MNISYFFSIFFFCSCGNTSDKEFHSKEKDLLNDIKKDSVYVILETELDSDNTKNPFDYWKVSISDTSGDNLEYRIDKNYFYYSFPTNNKSIITISNPLKGAEDILIYPNDTLKIKFIGNSLDVTKYNKGKDHSSCRSSDIYKLMQPGLLENLKKIDSLRLIIFNKQFINKENYILIPKKNISPKLIDTVTRQIVRLNEIDFESRQKKIESLKGQKKISDDFFNWAVINNKVRFLAMLQSSFLPDKRTAFSKYIQTINFFDDNLLSAFFSDYRGFIAAFYIPQIINKGKNASSGKNKMLIDFKLTYDSAVNYANGRTLQYIRLIAIKNIRRVESEDVFKEYYSKFKSEVTDQTYLKNAKNDLENNQIYVANKGSAIVDILKSNKYSWEEYLIQNKGKLIFVDFWASWCIPCRAVMQDSKKLREEYKNKDIVFVYISIDDLYTNWETAVNAEKLYDYKDSYLLLNSAESQLVKNFKITSIPRYLLYNRYGKIILSEAPGPDDSSIRDILNKYLVQ